MRVEVGLELAVDALDFVDEVVGFLVHTADVSAQEIVFGD